MQPRKAALWSTPFLWLIGVTLFLPTIKSCDRIESPAQLIRHAPLLDGLLLSPFLIAELLAVLILIPLLARREPSLRLTRAVQLLVLPLFASPTVLIIAFVSKPAHADQLLAAAGCALAMLATGVVLIAGLRREGWPRVLSAVVAFTLLTLPLATWFVFIACEDGLSTVYVGGYTFVAAMLGLTFTVASAARCVAARQVGSLHSPPGREDPSTARAAS